jgi:hypothetical protein
MLLNIQRYIPKRSLLSNFSTLVDRIRKIRTKEFYEKGNIDRNYYYIIDTRGRVFLANAKYKNLATCIKDEKFLHMLLRLIQPNNNISSDKELNNEFPFISYCGKEINYISPDDMNSVLGFTEFDSDNNVLYYGGGKLKQKFIPKDLLYCKSTGRIYHKLTEHKYLIKEKNHYGLLHPDMCLMFSNNIRESNNIYYFTWRGEKHLLETID